LPNRWDIPRRRKAPRRRSTDAFASMEKSPYQSRLFIVFDTRRCTTQPDLPNHSAMVELQDPESEHSSGANPSNHLRGFKLKA
jgi:hypothetical protein